MAVISCCSAQLAKTENDIVIFTKLYSIKRDTPIGFVLDCQSTSFALIGDGHGKIQGTCFRQFG
jgi:hypothetical protein